MGSVRVLSLLCTCTLALAAQEPYQHPTLRVPRLKEPPKLDGKLGAGEWDGASAIAGLVNHGLGGALAPQPQQVTFYLAYDDAHLYLAMHSPNPPGKYPVAWCGEPDNYAIHQDDHIEWQICKHDRAKAKKRGFGFYKVFVNPLGTQFDQQLYSAKGTDNRWSTGGETRCSITPEAWQLEMSISLKNLGEESLDGRSYVMHIVRADPGNQNLAYLAWAPGGWLAWDGFGEAVFAPEAPAVQLRSVGELTAGHLDAKLVVRASGKALDVSTRVRVTNAAGKELFTQTRTLEVKPQRSAESRFQKRDLPLSDKGNHLWIEARAGDKLLYHNRVLVNRLSPEQREKFVQGWIACYGDKPPAAIKPAEELPDSLLARMAGGRKKLRPLEEGFTKALKNANLDQAEALCRQMIKVAPSAPAGYYNLACLHARRGEREQALKLLEQAIDHGFNNVLHLKADPDLHCLHDELPFVALVEKAAARKPETSHSAVEPFLVTSQTAWVADANVELHPELRIPFARYRFGKDGPGGRKVTNVRGKAGELLRQWYAEGTAAGNWGDLYDNRDGDHSNMNRVLFPQLTWIEYTNHAKDARLHWGLAGSIVHEGVVIGNASVAQTSGPFWRSMPRLACGNQESADFLYWQYAHSQLYVYPGHVDYPRNEKELTGEGGRKRSDVFVTNTPYLIASQGSSSSDKPFLRALAATMAAFRPEVKKFLIQNGLLCPTLQLIFRMSNKPVAKPEDYLTGAAHPTVFAGGSINLEKMVTTAHEMTLDTVPPFVQLRVVEEDRPVNGRDFFAAPGRRETLFDTPCAIARVFRGVQQPRRLVVSAEASRDVHDRELTFRWAVLRGDAEAIRIRPLNKSGSLVELSVPYHPCRPVASGAVLESNRVDIGVFVNNGVYFSAPGFITFYSLDHEQREYDDKGRIQRITYTGAKERGDYVDPAVALPKSWRDEYHYGKDGKLTGWTRQRGDTKEEFNAEGKRIVRRDENGRPAETRAVSYMVRPRKPNQAPMIEPAED